MKKYLYLFLTVLLFGCSENKDTNIIDKEFQLNEQYFVGRRTSDKLANVYTKEIKSGLFGKDTIRHYLLNNWTNIEYWDGKGGVLVFKEFYKASNDGLEISITELSNLSYNYLIEKQEEEIKKALQEENLKVDISKRKQDIKNSISGIWHYKTMPQYNGETELLYEYTFYISNDNVKVNRSSYYYVYAIGPSSKKHEEYNCTLEDFKFDELNDNDEYIIKTKNCSQDFKAVYDNGVFEGLYFQGITDYEWKLLSR